MKSTKILGWLVMAAALTFTGCSVNDNTVEGPMEPPQTQTGNTIDLSMLTGDYVAQNGDVLTDTLSGFYKISIAPGATVTLGGVTIPGRATDGNITPWAGITCLGDATIVLADGTENYVKGYCCRYPGIQAGPAGETKAENTTLTIRGTGTLTVKTCMDDNDGSAGIGSGFNQTVGNITIEGGTITAIGGYDAAGIGSGRAHYGTASCGDITIMGGTITAMGDQHGAGIGTGSDASCGDITIGGTASGRAIRGNFIPVNIGAGTGGTCGSVSVADGTINNLATCRFTVKYYQYKPEGYMATPAYNVNANLIQVTIGSEIYKAWGTFTDGSTVSIQLSAATEADLTITSPDTGFDSDPYTGTNPQPKATFSCKLTGKNITKGADLGTVNLVMQ